MFQKDQGDLKVVNSKRKRNDLCLFKNFKRSIFFSGRFFRHAVVKKFTQCICKKHMGQRTNNLIYLLNIKLL